MSASRNQAVIAAGPVYGTIQPNAVENSILVLSGLHEQNYKLSGFIHGFGPVAQRPVVVVDGFITFIEIRLTDYTAVHRRIISSMNKNSGCTGTGRTIELNPPFAG